MVNSIISNDFALGIFEVVTDVKLYLSTCRDSLHHFEIVFTLGAHFLKRKLHIHV